MATRPREIPVITLDDDDDSDREQPAKKIIEKGEKMVKKEVEDERYPAPPLPPSAEVIALQQRVIELEKQLQKANRAVAESVRSSLLESTSGDLDGSNHRRTLTDLSAEVEESKKEADGCKKREISLLRENARLKAELLRQKEKNQKLEEELGVKDRTRNGHLLQQPSHVEQQSPLSPMVQKPKPPQLQQVQQPHNAQQQSPLSPMLQKPALQQPPYVQQLQPPQSPVAQKPKLPQLPQVQKPALSQPSLVQQLQLKLQFPASKLRPTQADPRLNPAKPQPQRQPISQTLHQSPQKSQSPIIETPASPSPQKQQQSQSHNDLYKNNPSSINLFELPVNETDSVPLSIALGQVRAKINWACWKRYSEKEENQVSLDCAVCEQTIGSEVFEHFLSSTHSEKVCARDGAVSRAALQHWLQQLELAADATAQLQQEVAARRGRPEEPAAAAAAAASKPQRLNICTRCHLGATGAISFDNALSQIQAAFDKCGTTKWSRYCSDWKERLKEKPDMTHACGVCRRMLLKGENLVHFLSSEHIDNMRACGAAIHTAALQHWLHELQLAEGAAAPPAAQPAAMQPPQDAAASEKPWEQPLNIFKRCRPGARDAIPFDTAVNQMRAKLDECGMEKWGRYCSEERNVNVSYACGVCEKVLSKGASIAHIFSHEHDAKMRSCGAAVSAAALQHWLHELEQAAAAAAPVAAPPVQPIAAEQQQLLLLQPAMSVEQMHGSISLEQMWPNGALQLQPPLALPIAPRYSARHRAMAAQLDKQMAVARTIFPSSSRTHKFHKIGHAMDIFQLCDPDSLDSVSFDEAFRQLMMKYEECGQEKWKKYVEDFGGVYPLKCTVCDEKHGSRILSHFFSKVHVHKFRESGAAISLLALQHWLQQLHNAARAAETDEKTMGDGEKDRLHDDQADQLVVYDGWSQKKVLQPQPLQQPPSVPKRYRVHDSSQELNGSSSSHGRPGEPLRKRPRESSIDDFFSETESTGDNLEDVEMDLE